MNKEVQFLWIFRMAEHLLKARGVSKKTFLFALAMVRYSCTNFMIGLPVNFTLLSINGSAPPFGFCGVLFFCKISGQIGAKNQGVLPSFY
jgi:hypothetical protein